MGDVDGMGDAPRGVPVQVHAYISPPPPAPSRASAAAHDTSLLRVKDGKIIELTNGTDTTGLRVDHVYQEGTERDVMERSLLPIVKASVEGVNTAVLAVGSIRSNKSELLFGRMDRQSLACAVLHSILSALAAKATTMNQNGMERGRQTMAFTVCVSFVEFYEETITDLLASASGKRKALTLEDGRCNSKCLRDLKFSPPLTSVDMFNQLLEAARQLRRKDTGLYGTAPEFTSAILQFKIRQVFHIQDSPRQELSSTMDIVDLPTTDRLARTGAMVRLSEGPLLNKSLFALWDCIEAVVAQIGRTDSVQPPFEDSQLTQLIQDSLGGNCLSFGLLFLSPRDSQGSQSTFHVGQKLQLVNNFPVINNDVVRGLLTRHYSQLSQLRQTSECTKDFSRRESGRSSGDDRYYIAKIHELEGKISQELHEKKLLKEDKDKVVSVMNELKAKYQQLFENEIEIRKELLACEQEKLSLSKAFVDFQMEKNAQIQDLDSEKFELETKLIQAEEMVVQIQEDDRKKAIQIQDLCQKMNEIIHQKQTLGEELSLLQKHCQALEHTVEREAKKNQQLSLEFIVLVNQKQKYQSEMESFEHRNREIKKTTEDAVSREQALRADLHNASQQMKSLEAQLEETRRELARKEVDIERMEFTTHKAQIEYEKQVDGLTREREATMEKLNATLTTQASAIDQEKKLLQLQLERAETDLQKCAKEKEQIMAAWVAKCQQHEELLVSTERLHHDNQSQLEEFRVKLSFFASAADKSQVVSELIQSYQSREKDLRNQVSSYQQRLHRLAHQISAIKHHHPDALHPELSEPTRVEANGGESASDSASELKGMRDRLWMAEQNVANQMEQAAQLLLKASALNDTIQSLQGENQSLKQQLEISHQTDRDNLQATKQLQQVLLQQLDEVRHIATLKQRTSEDSKQVIRPSTQPNKGQPQDVNDREVNQSELQAMITEKKLLEQKLTSSRLEWMQMVEKVERRCAELLTQTVSLDEENQQLRQSLKTLLKRLHGRV